MSVRIEWAMQCPSCGEDDKLDVVAVVSVRLTADGTDADESSNGTHEWDENSRCHCVGCGWSGKVRQAKKAFRISADAEFDAAAYDAAHAAAAGGGK